MLVALVKKKPHHRERLNFVEAFIEMGFLFLHSAVLCLAILDRTDYRDQEKRDMLGWLIINGVIIMFIGSLANLWIEEYFVLKRLYQRLRKLCRKEKEIEKFEYKTKNPLYKKWLEMLESVRKSRRNVRRNFNRLGKMESF